MYTCRLEAQWCRLEARRAFVVVRPLASGDGACRNLRVEAIVTVVGCLVIICTDSCYNSCVLLCYTNNLLVAQRCANSVGGRRYRISFGWQLSYCIALPAYWFVDDMWSLLSVWDPSIRRWTRRISLLSADRCGLARSLVNWTGWTNGSERCSLLVCASLGG